MARSVVARQIIKLKGKPQYRQNFISDNGNIILDVFNWQLNEPIKFEQLLNNIPGIICNGIFASRPADLIIVGHESSATIY
jgi:ribose 5-phosphate isomerase A